MSKRFKYYANPSLTLNAGSRAAPKAEFNLLSLNPFGSSLGLDAKAFTPSKLCSGLVPTDDSTAAATADAHVDATAQKQQQQQRQARPGSPPIKIIDSASEDEDDDPEAADDDKYDGLGSGQPDKPAAAAAGGSKQQPREQQQQQQVERSRGSASSDGSGSGSDSDDGSGSGSDSGDSPASDDDLEAAELASLLPDEEEGQEDEQAAGGLQQGVNDIDDDEDDEFIPLLPPVTPEAAATTPAAAAAASPAAAAAAAGAARSRGPPGYRPPWLPRLARFGSPLLRLHNEVVAFAKMLEPTPEEVDSRCKSMKVLREVVASIWPSAVVVVFGSYETGLYTPASDTDVVIMDSGLKDAQKGLRALAQALQQRQLVRNMQQVLTARVPIIKFEMVESGLAFDVSWEVPSGPQGAAVVKQLLQQWPVMKPLVLVLKVFLTQRELNEVYQGGIGSYSLIIMVAAFLQMHPSRRPGSSAAAAGGGGGSRKRGRSSSAGRALSGPLETNLGLLLVDFFRLYGRALNLTEVGVSCAGDGCFYSKAAAGFLMHDRPWALSVQDPLDPKNDTARNSYNIKIVRQVFDHAYQLLTAPFTSSESLLGRIIHLSPVVSGRPVPAWFDEPPAAGSGGHSGRSRRSGSSRAAARDKHHGGGSSSKGSRGGSRDTKRQRHREKLEQREAQKKERKERKQQKRAEQRQQHEQQDRDEGHRGRGSRDREQQQQQDSRGGGGSSKKQRRGSSGSGGGRDAAGRAGGATAAAAAAAGNEWQQQQQQQRRHHSSDSRSPGRKRQRR